MTTNRSLPVSKHFRLQQLADGIYAAIHQSGGGAICNAGIVDLGDRTLVFDTFVAPHPAQDLRAAAEALIGRPVNAVVNSHDHNDHIWGNQAFGPEADIVSTETTRRLIVTTGGIEDLDVYMADVEARLEVTLARLQASTDEGERCEHALWADEYRSILASRSILRVRVPNITFSGRMAFHGTARSAELLELAGHTASDAVLLLPQDGIAFVSDLLFVECHPYLADGDPGALLHALQAISRLAPRLVVPGHGPVGTADSLAQMEQYVHTLDGLARQMADAGEAEETIDALPTPKPYDGWLVASFFRANLHFLYRRHLQLQGAQPA
ncbi:MAG TPA: MBL fold metallo-hydrolase [Anaerolineae bacterium]|nr:MBL fold metallo-hydrolase [Anaerolineae bacterium]